MNKYLSRKNKIFAGLMLIIFILVIGCGNKDERNHTYQDVGAGSQLSYTASASVKTRIPGMSVLNRPGERQKYRSRFNKPSDVTNVTISASWGSGADADSVGPENCVTAGSYWQCDLTNLPADIPVTLTVSASDGAGVELYTGSSIVTIPFDTVYSAEITMVIVTPDPASSKAPIVTSFVDTSQAIMGVPLTLDVAISDGDSNTVTIEYSSGSGGTFAPASEVLSIVDNVANTSTIYTALAQDVAYTDTVTITLNDNTGSIANGNPITHTSTHTISVIPNDGDVNVDPLNLPPSITGISSSTDAVANTVNFTAHIDDEDPSTVSYLWDVDGAQAGGLVIGDPTITISTPADGAVVNVLVTDAFGETANYSMTWGVTANVDSYKITHLTIFDYDDVNLGLSSAGQVAWWGVNAGIFHFNGNTTTTLTSNINYNPYSISLNNAGQVVWEIDEGTGSEIFLYDGTFVLQVTNNDYDYTFPYGAVSLSSAGQVVWSGTGGSDGGTDIETFLYNGTSVIQLTTNNYDDNWPNLNDAGQMIWHETGGSDGGTDNEIFLYDGISVTQLTTNSYEDGIPRLNNVGQVVWSSIGGSDGGTDTEIFLYDGTSVTQLTTNDYDDLEAEINNAAQVLWSGIGGNDGGTDTEIFLYDGISVTQLTTNNYDDHSFRLNDAGQSFWRGTGGSDGGTDYEIFLYDGNSVIQLTANDDNDWDYSSGRFHFHFNNAGQVVWASTGGSDGGTDAEMFLYDGNSVIQLTTNDYDDNWVFGFNNAGQVIWSSIGGSDGGTDTEVFLYDGTSVIQLTANDYDEFLAYTLNDIGQVVWDGTGGSDGGTDLEIFFYDGTSVIQLTTNDYDDWSPDLNDASQVTWSGRGGSDGGIDAEVFLAIPN